MKVLGYSDLKPTKGIGFTRQHIRRMELAGEFPYHVNIGVRSIAWVETEVDAWLRGKAGARDHARAA